MIFRTRICQLWSTVILLAGAASAIAGTDRTIPNERLTAEVIAVRRACPSVGNIHTEKASSSGNAVFSAERGKKINGMGTGFIVDERGYMVTNFHVIADVDTILVDIEDENRIRTKYVARRVRVDKEHDLAIIKLEPSPSKPFRVIPCGTSADLMLCEKVIAIGNAFGYDNTVTTGAVSAKGRDVEAANDAVSYKNLIQTDAAINPGNSGGPLININGEIIGINVAIRQNANKIGFAIPIDDARKVIAKMLSIESIDGTYHGLICKDVVEIKEVDSMSTPVRSLVVEGFQNESPAAIAGFRPGDVILRAAGIDVYDTVDLERALLHRRVNDRVELSYKRNDRIEKASLVLAKFTGARSSFEEEVQITARANNDDRDRYWPQLGLRMSALPANERSLLGPNRYKGGMKILEVTKEGPAFNGGIKPGDILVGLSGRETHIPAHIDWIINDISKQPVSTDSSNKTRFIVIRAKEDRAGELQLTPIPRTAALGN